MATAQEKHPAMTLAEFRAWRAAQPEGARYELLGGVVIQMMNERFAHQAAKFAIASQLRGQLPPGAPCRPIIDGMSVQIDDESEFEPDVFIHCHPEQRGRDATHLSHPSVVIEVLSPSTRASDLLQKAPRYLAIEGLVALVIVDIEQGREGALVYDPRKPFGAPTQYGRDAVLPFTLPGGAEVALDLGAVFDEVDRG